MHDKPGTSSRCNDLNGECMNAQIAGNLTFSVNGTDYAAQFTAFPASVPRPAGNTGTGFFVAGGQLYDPTGKPYRIRGVNRGHYDSSSGAGIAKSGANTVRIFTPGDKPAAQMAAICQTDHVAKGQLVIPCCNYVPGTRTSGSNDVTVLDAAETWWVANYAVWAPLQNSMILNVANEWGPANSQSWFGYYGIAITYIRKAGFTCPILIDSGGSGQDDWDIANYAVPLLATDPQHNLLFGIHLYGTATPANYLQRIQSYAALAAKGVCVIVSEFGPGQNIGPSPTLVTPTQIVEACEANGIGWLAWAWDDNNLAGGHTSPTGAFGMTLNGPGLYTQPSDLTAYGQTVVGLLAKYGGGV